MSLLKFSILVVTNVLGALKSSLLITQVGVDSLSHLKMLQLPISFAIVYGFTTLKKRYHQQYIFSSIIALYILFLLVFAHVWHPVAAQPTASRMDGWSFLDKVMPLVYHWPITLLYLLTDLWPVLLYTNCFWELSNRIVSTQEAPRLYGLYNIFGQSNILFTAMGLYAVSGGMATSYLRGWQCDMPQLLSNTTSVIMVVILVVYNYINYAYSADAPRISPGRSASTLSFGQTVKLLWTHQHIANLFFSTLSYTTAVCIIDILRHHFLSEHYAAVTLLVHFQAKTLFCIGLITMGLSLSMQRLMHRWGWYAALRALPYTCFVAAVLLLSMLLMPSLQVVPLLYVTTVLYVLAKAMKYSLFDTAKEMAYIPIGAPLKFYGKLSADTLANSLGRILGTSIPVLFFTLHWERSFDQRLTLYLTTALVLMCSLWLLYTKRLRASYQAVLKQQASP